MTETAPDAALLDNLVPLTLWRSYVKPPVKLLYSPTTVAAVRRENPTPAAGLTLMEESAIHDVPAAELPPTRMVEDIDHWVNCAPTTVTEDEPVGMWFNGSTCWVLTLSIVNTFETDMNVAVVVRDTQETAKAPATVFTWILESDTHEEATPPVRSMRILADDTAELMLEPTTVTDAAPVAAVFIATDPLAALRSNENATWRDVSAIAMVEMRL